MEEVTIVIPYRNRESYLRRTLSYIVHQQFRPLRLILVDNGSTDGSRQVCEQFVREHHNSLVSFVLASEPKPGAAAARNRGLVLCQTPFVYFFDSDDEFDPQFLPTIQALLTPDLDLLAVTTRQVVRGKDEVRAFRPTTSVVAQILVSHLATQSMVFRTDFLRSIGGWNESLTTWDDWELGIRALAHRPRLRWWTDRAFHRIYVHADSLTGENFSSTIGAIRKALLAARTALPSNCTTALLFRMEILTGELLRERNRAEATENKKLIREWFSGESVWNRWMGRLLRFYTSKGGRGAWRLAYLLCPAPKQP
jgi:glycosyltransferase involved in cell wall biosynthesis